jgi:hypothetical protein
MVRCYPFTTTQSMMRREQLVAALVQIAASSLGANTSRFSIFAFRRHAKKWNPSPFAPFDASCSRDWVRSIHHLRHRLAARRRVGIAAEIARAQCALAEGALDGADDGLRRLLLAEVLQHHRA